MYTVVNGKGRVATHGLLIMELNKRRTGKMMGKIIRDYFMHIYN